MSKTQHATTDNADRYRCPLDGSVLNGWVDPGWYCPHEHGKGTAHHTIIAFDVEQECTVEQIGAGTRKVLNDD